MKRRRKLLNLLFIVLLAIGIGGIYGVLHDQLTYSISPEYYTRFKFYQFGLADEGEAAVFSNPRLLAALVGLLATWWMGALIGLVLGLASLTQPTRRAMRRVAVRAFFLTTITAFGTGLVGLAYGWLVLAARPRADFTHWFIPAGVINFRHYVAVGSMHNFSYLGGLLGLLAGIVYILRNRPAPKSSTRL